jgi:hypothetical protein
MKPRIRACLSLGVVGLFGAGAALAQVAAPSNPNRFTKRNLGESGGSTASAGASAVAPASRTVIVRHIAVTPVEVWKNASGEAMEARLLAFSAPAAGGTGPVEVIREGMVRFLVTGRKEPVDYPLARLGEEERKKIEALAAVAGKGAPQ